MSSRIDLQYKLEELIGTKEVYYQPPETIKMEYPAIVYSKSNIRSVYANDAKYFMKDCYEIIVIDRRPDNPVIKELLSLPYSAYGRRYKADNLYHDTITLYY